jgi:uncharacterized RDD family membrane protein YckC
MESQDRIKTIFWRRLFSALTDLLFIYCTGFLAHLLVMQWIFLDPFFFFALSWITYYALCNLLFNGRTLAKAITGLQVVSMDNDRIAPRQIVIREVVSKFIILLLLPYYIIHRVQIYGPPLQSCWWPLSLCWSCFSFIKGHGGSWPLPQKQ